MRHDMFKVIVERPRVGGYEPRHPFRRAKRFDVFLDEDGLLDVDDEFSGSHKLPMRPFKYGSGDRKTLNENLNPLYRFLESRAGQLWDDVFSELCEHLDCSSTVKQHVRDHVEDHVLLHTYLGEDGNVYSLHSRRWPYGLRADSYDLYVHPETGVLTPGRQRKERIWRKRLKERQALFEANNVILDAGRRFTRIDGSWWYVELRELLIKFDNLTLAERLAYRRTGLYGAPKLDALGNDPRAWDSEYPGYYAAMKRPAYRKEKKLHRLG